MAVTTTKSAAVNKPSQFNTYVVPKLPMSDGAIETTGVRVTGYSMTAYGETVTYSPLAEAAEQFMNFIPSFAYNDHKFYFVVLSIIPVSSREIVTNCWHELYKLRYHCIALFLNDDI